MIGSGRVLALALGLVATAGCADRTTTIDGIKDPIQGPITVLRPASVCVGGPAASGDCFKASPTQLHGLRAGECVVARWKSGGQPGAAPDDLISIKPAAGTPPDC